MNTRGPLVVLYDIEGSDVYDPLQTLVNIILYAHGFMEKPLYTPEIHLL